jgi:hypothetical protein
MDERIHIGAMLRKLADADAGRYGKIQGINLERMRAE